MCHAARCYRHSNPAKTGKRKNDYLEMEDHFHNDWFKHLTEIRVTIMINTLNLKILESFGVGNNLKSKWLEKKPLARKERVFDSNFFYYSIVIYGRETMQKLSWENVKTMTSWMDYLRLLQLSLVVKDHLTYSWININWILTNQQKYVHWYLSWGWAKYSSKECSIKKKKK